MKVGGHQASFLSYVHFKVFHSVTSLVKHSKVKGSGGGWSSGLRRDAELSFTPQFDREGQQSVNELRKR